MKNLNEESRSLNRVVDRFRRGGYPQNWTIKQVANEPVCNEPIGITVDKANSRDWFKEAMSYGFVFHKWTKDLIECVDDDGREMIAYLSYKN
tara:strand:- start:1254 stop:1529 length:276 start_codon:yes stop_codon:yes gene_type:complete